MDYQKYIIMALITFCVGMSIWFVLGLILGTTFNYIGAGFGFTLGYVGCEMVKDYFKARKDAKKS